MLHSIMLDSQYCVYLYMTLQSKLALVLESVVADSIYIYIFVNSSYKIGLFVVL